jgi:V/A-type H+-transporting ATPase subunit F
MKVIVIGHPDAVLGFSLAGVDGKVATTAAQANQALDDTLASRDVGVILVTGETARLIEARMDKLKLRSHVPLVIEIPGPEGLPSDQPSLNDVVFRAIGVRI